MNDLIKERLLSLKEARQEFPNRPGIATLWRWTLKGIGGVQLESVRIGGRRYTSWEACQRFVAARSSAMVTRAEVKSERHRQLNAVQTLLNQLGV